MVVATQFTVHTSSKVLNVEVRGTTQTLRVLRL